MARELDLQELESVAKKHGITSKRAYDIFVDVNSIHKELPDLFSEADPFLPAFCKPVAFQFKDYMTLHVGHIGTASQGRATSELRIRVIEKDLPIQEHTIILYPDKNA